MSPLICLVTNEIYPVTDGGCGTLIYNSVYELLSAGHHVWLLADIAQSKLTDFEENHLNQFPHRERLIIFNVSDFFAQKGALQALHPGLSQSQRFYRALSKILENHPHPDIIEFPDYKGYAYDTLAAREAGLLQVHSKIVIRFHLTIELIDRQSVGVTPGEGKCITYGLERWCLDHADEIVVASKAMADLLYETYRINTSVTSSTPSLAALGIKPRRPKNPQHKVLFFSRLARQKGAELFIKAAVKLLRDDSVISKPVLIIAGPDTHESPVGGAMTPYLLSQIPSDLRSYFKFPGYLSHQRLNDLHPEIVFAVFPSRQETYCYGAREIALAGVPLIVSDIPALSDLVESGAAISSSLDQNDLYTKMKKMYQDEKFRKSLRLPWNPRTAFLNPYLLQRATPKGEDKKCSSPNIRVMIFCNNRYNEKALQITRESIEKSGNLEIIEAHETKHGDIPLRGKYWKLDGHVTNNLQAICFLEAGDKLPGGYFRWAQSVLASDRKIGVVGCRLSGNNPESTRNIPWDVVPELIPFQQSNRYLRCVIRCDKEIMRHAFDSLWMDLHECAAIWCAIEKGFTCLRHPEQGIEPATDRGNKSREHFSQPVRYHLVSMFSASSTKLRLTETLKQIALTTPLDNTDLLKAMQDGNTPQVGGLRLNIRNLFRLLILRITSYRFRNNVIKNR